MNSFTFLIDRIRKMEEERERENSTSEEEEGEQEEKDEDTTKDDYSDEECVWEV